MKNFTRVLGFSLLLLSMSAVQAAGDHGHSHDEEQAMDDHGSDHHGSGHHDGGDDHGGDGHHGGDMDGKKSAMFLVKKEIDGYDVSFHVMKAKPGKAMGGSHDFMIKIEQAGKALTNVVINTKVIHPDGSSESKRTMKMGDWYRVGYDLGHHGKHQLMILFKTMDGKKHKGGVYY